MAIATINERGGYVELAGLSTDTKPTDGIATGSTFLEVNTSKVFVYDSENETWHEIVTS